MLGGKCMEICLETCFLVENSMIDISMWRKNILNEK